VAGYFQHASQYLDSIKAGTSWTDEQLPAYQEGLFLMKVNDRLWSSSG